MEETVADKRKYGKLGNLLTQIEYVTICNSVIRAQMRVGQNDCILSGLVLCEDAENLKK